MPAAVELLKRTVQRRWAEAQRLGGGLRDPHEHKPPRQVDRLRGRSYPTTYQLRELEVVQVMTYDQLALAVSALGQRLGVHPGDIADVDVVASSRKSLARTVSKFEQSLGDRGVPVVITDEYSGRV